MEEDTYTSTVMTPNFVKDASRADVYVAEIPFVDAGHYTFDIKYTDRSGNVYDSYEKDVFTVDMTAPEISVSYDNDSAKNNDQFKADREATIQIVEHNFDPTKVGATVTANGAEVTTSNPATYTVEDAISLGDYNVSELYFAGWFNNAALPILL